MGQLYPSELKDPSEWVDKNAQDILDSVKKAGGWAKIFPKGVPTWLHKLRNYFNVEPKYLRLVDNGVTSYWMQQIRSFGKLNSFVGKRALSGDVYFDDEIEVWYQMGAGGSIYHWGNDVIWEPADAAYTHSVRGQTGIPIFKLVSPDGTGGSRETIVTNPVIQTTRVVGPLGVEVKIQRGSKIGATNVQVPVRGRVVTYMKHQGSYNFAETSVVGLDSHRKNDVEPHHKDAVYIDPPDRFEPLKDRFFFDYVILRAGGTTPQKKRPSTYEDDIREDPPMRKR